MGGEKQKRFGRMKEWGRLSLVVHLASSKHEHIHTHTLEHMDIIPENTLIFYPLDMLNDLYSPDCVCCVLTSHLYSPGSICSSLRGIAQPVPSAELCLYMPLWGLKSDRPSGFISDVNIPPCVCESSNINISSSQSGQVEVCVCVCECEVCLWAWVAL